MHLIDEEQRAGASGLRDLTDLANEVGEVLLWIARVGDPGCRVDIELELHGSGHGDAEGFDDRERSPGALLDSVAPAHLSQQAGPPSGRR